MTVEDLYRAVIAAWNQRDAAAFEEQFIVDGEVVGFDGTQVIGQGSIGEEMRKVFADHPTRKYITKILGVNQVATDVAIVRAIAGMPNVDGKGFDPKLHAVQRMTAVQRNGAWRIALLQTTPAQLHGRPHELDEMTKVLAGELPD